MSKTRSHRSTRQSLRFESLESRQLFSATPTISISDATAVEGEGASHFSGTFVQDNFNTLVFGPDGNLFAVPGGSGNEPNTVRRYDGVSGAFLDTFATAPTANALRDLIFHSDGYLYVASIYTDEVLRFNGTTGDFVDVFVQAGSGGISDPDGLAFGPDANADGVPELYVTGWTSHNVIRYDGRTGLPLGSFITPGSGGLSYPFDLEFGPDGAYVTSAGTNQILKYDALTGAFLGIAAEAGLSYPRDVTFGPDGMMYVASGNNDRVLRFTAGGEYVDDYVPQGAGGMDNPRSLAFGPEGDLYVVAHGDTRGILRFGKERGIVFAVQLSGASTTPISVDYSTIDGTAQAGTDFVAASGTLTFAPGQTTQTIFIQTEDDTSVEPTESLSVVLSNPIGGTITDGTGIGTILDDDAKFYVVNDAAADSTFRYDGGGATGSTSALTTGNTAPRGAASTAAGDKVWVVDANKTVYVYNAGGMLLGSWLANGLNTRAQVEGIATNGTDVWLVDAKECRVFCFPGAAGRVSGSQNGFFTSFKLNAANKSPKDLVTDGTYLWVVDDSTTDKVFKYTLSGSLVGSWTIATSGATKPTGITLDPSAPSDLWIVDNGTDRVYQYTAAISKTSGSLSATASFPLAAGNTNPQGIADPPPSSLTNVNNQPADLFSALDSALETDPPPADAPTPSTHNPSPWTSTDPHYQLALLTLLEELNQTRPNTKKRF